MKEHAWEIEEVDGGSAGADDFWVCRACGGGGGPVDVSVTAGSVKLGTFRFVGHRRTTPTPFLPGPALPLSDDCDEAVKQIAAFKLEEEAEHDDQD